MPCIADLGFAAILAAARSNLDSQLETFPDCCYYIVANKIEELECELRSILLVEIKHNFEFEHDESGTEEDGQYCKDFEIKGLAIAFGHTHV